MKNIEEYLDSDSTSCTLMIRFPDWHRPHDDRFILISVFDADSEEEHLFKLTPEEWAEVLVKATNYGE